jgi:hypothetical protein
MSKPLLLIVFLSGGALLALAGFLLTRAGGRGNQNDSTIEVDDPLLKSVRARNPGLTIEKHLQDDFDRIPVYWVVDPGSGRRALLPRSEAENDELTIRFLNCESQSIPERLKYPGARDLACVELTSDSHILSAMAFDADARLDDLLDHYDGKSRNVRRPGRWAEQTRREETRPDGTNVFLYSYFLHEVAAEGRFRVHAFVGYRRERRSSS